MKNGMNQIFILILGIAVLGLCSCQSVHRPPREAYGASGQYGGNPYAYPMTMYSGIVPPEHWYQPMPGYPPMYQPACQPYQPMPAAQPMPTMPQPMPGGYPQQVIPQQSVPPMAPGIQQPYMMPAQPKRIDQMEKDLVPPGRDSGASHSKPGFSPFNDKLVRHAPEVFLVRGQSPDAQSDPFALNSDDPFAFESDATDESTPDESAFTIPEEPDAMESIMEESAPIPEAVTPRGVPKQVAEATMPPVQACQFMTRTDFSTRKQEPLTIDAELKMLGQGIPYHPQVHRENWNPGPWTPGSQLGAWPQDEYLADGGDDWEKVRVDRHWEVRGLNPEDTIVHYDTLQNQLKVQPSNRVHIYSPRFGSVRQVHGLVENEQLIGFGTVDNTSRVALAADRQNAGTTSQRNQTGYARQNTLPHGANTRVNAGHVSTPTGMVALKQNEHVRSFTDLLTHKTFTSAQLLYLAEGKRNAVAWGSIDSLTVNVDALAPMSTLNVQRAQEVLVIGDGETSPKLEVFKVASTDSAQRGEIIEFFIRFDNVGTELLGNLTVMDSLAPRLEYIPGSAGSSVEAEFFTEPNDVGSLVLRWEISEPLKTGDFGVVRFRCRVQ